MNEWLSVTMLQVTALNLLVVKDTPQTHNSSEMLQSPANCFEKMKQDKLIKLPVGKEVVSVQIQVLALTY